MSAKKATDAEITLAYEKTSSITLVAQQLGMSYNSVRERLIRIGTEIKKAPRVARLPGQKGKSYKTKPHPEQAIALALEDLPESLGAWIADFIEQGDVDEAGMVIDHWDELMAATKPYVIARCMEVSGRNVAI